MILEIFKNLARKSSRVDNRAILDDQEVYQPKKFETIFTKSDYDLAQMLCAKVKELLDSNPREMNNKRMKQHMSFISEAARSLCDAEILGLIDKEEFDVFNRESTFFDTFKNAFDTEKVLHSTLIPEEVSYTLKWMLVNSEIKQEMGPDQTELLSMLSRSDQDLAHALDFVLQNTQFPIADLMVPYLSFTDWEHNREHESDPTTIEAQKLQARLAIVQCIFDSAIMDAFKREFVSDSELKERLEKVQDLDDYDLLMLLASFYEDCQISHPAQTKFLVSEVEHWLKDENDAIKAQARGSLNMLVAQILTEVFDAYRHKLDATYQDKPIPLLSDAELVILAVEKLHDQEPNYTISQHIKGLVRHHLMSGSFKVLKHRDVLLRYIRPEGFTEKSTLSKPSESGFEIESWENNDEVQTELDFEDQPEEFNKIRTLIADMVEAYGIDKLLIEDLEFLDSDGLIRQLETIREELLFRLSDERIQTYSKQDRSVYRNAAYDVDMLIADIRRTESRAKITSILDYIKVILDEDEKKFKEKQVVTNGLIGEIKRVLQDFSRHKVIPIDMLLQSQRTVWAAEKALVEALKSHDHMRTVDFGSDYGRYAAAEWNRINRYVLDDLSSDLSKLLLMVE